MEILLDTGPRPGQNHRKAVIANHDVRQTLVIGLGIAGALFVLANLFMTISAAL
jgi:hypothetical protein